MALDILAKSEDLKKHQKEETLVEHTQNLLDVFQIIITQKEENKKSEDKNLIKMAAVFHDLGKINSNMQKQLRLSNEINRTKDEEKKNLLREEREKLKKAQCTRHNILSASMIKMITDELELKQEDIDILYKSVMLHHGKYEDYIKISSSKVQEDIYKYIEKDILETNEYNIKNIEDFIENNLNVKINISGDNLDYKCMKYLGEDFKEDINKVRYIKIKGFLNLIDHIASSGEKNIKFYNDKNSADIDSLIKKNIKEKLEKNGCDISENEIKFTKLQENLKNLEKENVLTIAFTGAGKTAADDRKYFIRKVYLVPNKISAESFYMDSIFKNEENYVGILNGDINLYLDNEKTDEMSLSLRDINLSRNFCRPYIIATVDQILLSMFKFPGYEKIFAAIENASITVDEVHLMEPRMFLILILFIQFSTKYFNTKFHLMTATLPASYKEEMEKSGFEFVKYGENLKTKEKVTFIESNTEKASSNNKKIKTNFIKEKEILKIVNEALKNKKQILIIRNSIDDVISTYNNLQEKFPDKKINVLHTRFKFEDKKEKYSKILKQDGEIWISTQSVEIALDLDFPVIISDMAPMECLIQRMGRCNRHDKYETGDFYILEIKKDVYNEKLKTQTKIILNKEIKKNNIWGMDTREELLNAYYADSKVKKYYAEEFKNAKNDIKDIYGIKTDDFDGTDLILQFEPYKNITDNKKEASKLFRNVEINYKVILEEDFTESINEILKKEIQISKGIFYKLDNLNLLKHRNGYLILEKSKFYEYKKEIGLVINLKAKEGE